MGVCLGPKLLFVVEAPAGAAVLDPLAVVDPLGGAVVDPVPVLVALEAVPLVDEVTDPVVQDTTDGTATPTPVQS